MKYLILAALLVLGGGCVGTHFTFDDVRQIRVGMTEEEVTKIMGKPNTVTSMGDQLRWVYAYGNALGNGRSAVFMFKDGKVTEAPTVPASFK